MALVACGLLKADAAAASLLNVTPAMLSGSLSFFATRGGVDFADPIPYGFANNLSDIGWIWPNDNSGQLVVDFGVPTVLTRFRVYCVYNGGERGATWVIEHSKDQSAWFHSADFAYRQSKGAGLDEIGKPADGFGGWYEVVFNEANLPDRYWRIRQKGVLAGHAPRSGQMEFHGRTGPGLKPRVKSSAPTGNTARKNGVITVELEDGAATQVAPATVQLLLDGLRVAPTMVQAPGTNVTTVTYDPPGDLEESAHMFRIIFGDSSAPPVLETNDFHFVVINDEAAARIINLDFNGARNDPGPDLPGLTFSGQGAAGGGHVWNGLNADSRVRIGASDDDQLLVSGTRLLNSIGELTAIAFTISPVGGDFSGTPTSDPKSRLSLVGDEIVVGFGGQGASRAEFTINGLAADPVVDLYFYLKSGNITIAGTEEATLAASSEFDRDNTRVFKAVAVSGGAIQGSLSGDPGRLAGLTIARPAPHPVVKTVSPTGRAVAPSSTLLIELEDYVSQVAAASIELLLNDQKLSPAVAKLAGSKVTSVRFDPRGALPGGLNTVRVIFSDTASPAVVQTFEYSFMVVGGTHLPVTPEMLSGPLNFFASPPGLKFADPIPYGIANNVSDNGWIWPNDNRGNLVIDFETPTTLVKFRVYSTYPGGQRGAKWAIEHSDDQAIWINSTNFLFETTVGGGVDDDGTPRTDYAGWYEILFNSGGEAFRYWRISQTAITASHAPRAGKVEFYQRAGPATPLVIFINTEGGKLTVAWADPFDTAVLQSAEAVAGPWGDVPNAFGPHTVTPSGSNKFYRLRRDAP